MLTEILANILKLSDFIIIFTIILISLILLLNYLFNHFKFNVKSIKQYALFIHLDNQSIVALSAIFIKYIFTVWYIFALPTFGVEYLLVLILLVLVINISLRKYKSIFFELVNCCIEYLTWMLLGLLVGYSFEVKVIWYVIVMIILLAIFIFIYSSYLLLKKISDAMIKE